MKKSLADVGVSAAISAAAGLVYWEALKYKPGTYDPLGSGAMPRMVALIIIGLCAIAIVQSLLAPAPPQRRAAEPGEDFMRRPWLAVVIFVYVLLATILLYFRVPFGVTASLMLFASIMTIRRGERAMILPGAACSVAFGFGLSLLFGGLFGVDLP